MTVYKADDGTISISQQAEMLIADVGTKHEWTCVGPVDNEGLTEVLLMCHPIHATKIAKLLTESGYNLQD